jgi:hypothetical protein
VLLVRHMPGSWRGSLKSRQISSFDENFHPLAQVEAIA